MRTFNVMLRSFDTMLSTVFITLTLPSGDSLSLQSVYYIVHTYDCVHVAFLLIFFCFTLLLIIDLVLSLPQSQRRAAFHAIGRFFGLCLWFRYTIPFMVCRHVAKFFLGRYVSVS